MFSNSKRARNFCEHHTEPDHGDTARCAQAPGTSNRVQTLTSYILVLPSPPPAMADPNGTITTAQSPEQATYDPKPTLQYASTVGLQAAGVGALVSAIQNAVGSHGSGAAGFFTRTGGTIGFFGAS